MLRQKDKLSAFYKIYISKKRLANLNELYSAFKFQNLNVKTIYPKFCTLHPKWCILTGSSGTHSEYVCATYQNLLLLVHACSTEEHYSDLFDTWSI